MMQDRYLFRGKQENNGNWVEGALCLMPTHAYIVYDNDFYLHTECGITSLMSDSFVIVALDTICRCTGLRDRNGTLIFEGDILNEGGYHFAVILNQERAKFMLKHGEKAVQYPEWNRGVRMIIIGNVHDNPELLSEVRE